MFLENIKFLLFVLLIVFSLLFMCFQYNFHIALIYSDNIFSTHSCLFSEINVHIFLWICVFSTVELFLREELMELKPNESLILKYTYLKKWWVGDGALVLSIYRSMLFWSKSAYNPTDVKSSSICSLWKYFFQ